MRNYRTALSLMMATIMAFALSSSCAAEPLNLDLYKEQLRQYRRSGEYYKDITKVTTEAEKYLLEKIRENLEREKPKKLAIILDVDETSIISFSDVNGINMNKDKKKEKEKDKKKKGKKKDKDKKKDSPAIPPVLNLYRTAIEHHVRVFFVTGRRERGRKTLEKKLKKAGYLKWRGLYMKPKGLKKNSVVPYKVSMRKKIANRGYDIVLTMGDQESDLEGPYTGRKFKIPNPFYLID